MNPDKINKWLDFAKTFTGNDFWSDIFDQQKPQEGMGNNPFFNGKPGGATRLFPAADILFSDQEIVVLIDLPGVAKEDVRLSLHDEVLYVKGEVKPLFPQYSSYTSERFSGSFERPIGLPVRFDGQTTQVRAAFHQGTLIVRIPVSSAWNRNIRIE